MRAEGQRKILEGHYHLGGGRERRAHEGAKRGVMRLEKKQQNGRGGLPWDAKAPGQREDPVSILLFNSV
jgi:hypothetical protein